MWNFRGRARRKHRTPDWKTREVPEVREQEGKKWINKGRKAERMEDMRHGKNTKWAIRKGKARPEDNGQEDKGIARDSERVNDVKKWKWCKEILSRNSRPSNLDKVLPTPGVHVNATHTPKTEDTRRCGCECKSWGQNKGIPRKPNQGRIKKGANIT